MLDIEKISLQFYNRKEEILEEFKQLQNNTFDYTKSFTELSQLSEQEFKAIAGEEPIAEPVAFNRPFIRHIDPITTPEALRVWSLEKLANSSITAIDGSQINPARDLSYYIALVQAAYFTIEYPVHFDTESSAEIKFDVFPKLLISKDGRVIKGSLSEGDISLYRMEEEFNLVKKCLQPDFFQRENSLILLDGTIILSYLQNLNPKTAKEMIDNLVKVLDESQKTKIPLIGYIDTSYAKDLANLLHILAKDENPPLSDPGFLKPSLPNMGDFTIPFLCRRHPLSEYGSFKEQICFSYIRVNSKRPVRLEFPKWIYDAGLYDEVVHRIIAHTILGHGYPQVLTRAHQTAVLRQSDREQFNNITLAILKDRYNLPVEEMIKQRLKHNFT